MGTVTEFKRKPYDQETEGPVIDPDVWGLAGLFSIREWGQMIAALQTSPYPADHDLAVRVEAAVPKSRAQSMEIHPSSQIPTEPDPCKAMVRTIHRGGC